MASKTYTPGTPTPRSGIYDKVGPRGGNTGQQADSTKGNPLPPSARPGETWRLNTPARHKSSQ